MRSARLVRVRRRRVKAAWTTFAAHCQATRVELTVVPVETCQYQAAISGLDVAKSVNPLTLSGTGVSARGLREQLHRTVTVFSRLSTIWRIFALQICYKSQSRRPESRQRKVSLLARCESHWAAADERPCRLLVRQRAAARQTDFLVRSISCAERITGWVRHWRSRRSGWPCGSYLVGPYAK